ncbi:hypothetical protein Tco_0971910 [Tanacetum coccineum]
MLKKGGYDTWESRILLYIEGKENGQMLLNYILKGPYQLNKVDDPRNPKIGREKGKRLYTMVELKDEERKQVKCDIKVANIIQRLPNDIYTFLNHKKTAKSIWNRVKELMDGTELRQQEKETKLTDEFTSFTFKNGKSIHSYYLRFAKNTINVTVTRNYVGNVERIAGNVGNTGNWTDRLDESDSDCKEDLSTNAIFMVKFRLAGSLTENDVGPSYDTDALFEGFITVLAILVTGASQSRQRGKSESDSYYISD